MTHEDIAELRALIIPENLRSAIDSDFDPSQYLNLYRQYGIDSLDELKVAIKDMEANSILTEIYADLLERTPDELANWTYGVWISKAGGPAIEQVREYIAASPERRKLLLDKI